MTDNMKLDEKEAQEIMEDLNDRYASALLLFAWQKFQHYPKGLVTRITALDTSGFTAETTTTTHENIHNIYKFTDDDNKRNKNKSLKQKLTDTIYMNMKIPKCPPQGYICYAIWAFFYHRYHGISTSSFGRTAAALFLYGIYEYYSRDYCHDSRSFLGNELYPSPNDECIRRYTTKTGVL